MKTKKMPADYSGIEDQRRGWAGNLVEQFKNRAARKELVMKDLQEKKKTKQQKDTERVRNYNVDRQGSTTADIREARKAASDILQQKSKKARLRKPPQS